jgi:hypothetical protein
MNGGQSTGLEGYIKRISTLDLVLPALFEPFFSS